MQNFYRTFRLFAVIQSSNTLQCFLLRANYGQYQKTRLVSSTKVRKMEIVNVLYYPAIWHLHSKSVLCVLKCPVLNYYRNAGQLLCTCYSNIGSKKKGSSNCC